MKIIYLSILIWLSVSTIFAEELPEDFKRMKEQVIAYYRDDNFAAAQKLVKEYIDANEAKLSPRTLQSVYLLYSETLDLQGFYKEAVEILKEAIDKYDSDLEPRLNANYKEYVKYSRKPKLLIDPWPNDPKSCDSLKGIWVPPSEGKRIIKNGYCNLPTTDAGKECQDWADCQEGCIVDKSIKKGTRIEGRCSERLDFSENGCAYIVVDGVAAGGYCSWLHKFAFSRWR